MDAQTFSSQEMEAVARNHKNPNAGDDQLHVTFSGKAVPDERATVEAGRPIFKDVDWIVINIPGSRDDVQRPVRESDKSRFPRQWAAYKAGKAQEGTTGTPLSMWPGVTRAQAEELAFFGAKTVEQLAEMPDGNLQKFMGGNALKQRAKDFIAAAKGEAPMAQMRSELEKRDAELAALREQVDAMAKAQADKTKK
jgi:hypothetical protein